MILILPKMVSRLKAMDIFIESRCDHDILDEFMVWLVDYMHARDFNQVDMKLMDHQVSFCF